MLPRDLALLGIVFWGLGPPSADAAPPETRSIPLTVEPTRVEIGLLYSGADMTVSAETEPGTEVAMLVTGTPSELVMREQARRWGLFWAPAGEVIFEDVPSLYLLYTTVEAEELAPTPLLDELGIGYASLERRLGRESRPDLARELIALKESEGLFSSTVADEEEEPPVFRTVVHVPARAPTGAYAVRLFTFRNGRLVGGAEATFELGHSGLVSFVSSLAQTHGLAYGILVGFLFGSTRKKT
jgi:uncharacterized protein (TIGR02186 family)